MLFILLTLAQYNIFLNYIVFILQGLQNNLLNLYKSCPLALMFAFVWEESRVPLENHPV